MKYYYATGNNGSVIECEDSRMADTVEGSTTMSMDHMKAFELLDNEADSADDAEWSTTPLLSDFSVDEMAEYVDG